MTVSTSCPIVILDGNAWGLMIISGRRPSAVKGMSDSGIINPIVPFWPHRLQNLSPIAGILSSRILTLAILNPSSPSVMNVLSTYPSCPFLGEIEESTALFGSVISDNAIPIRTILSSSFVFSLISPYSSRWL